MLVIQVSPVSIIFFSLMLLLDLPQPRKRKWSVDRKKCTGTVEEAKNYTVYLRPRYRSISCISAQFSSVDITGQQHSWRYPRKAKPTDNSKVFFLFPDVCGSETSTGKTRFLLAASVVRFTVTRFDGQGPLLFSIPMIGGNKEVDVADSRKEKKEKRYWQAITAWGEREKKYLNSRNLRICQISRACSRIRKSVKRK